MKKTYIVFFIITSLACILLIFVLATGAWEQFFTPKPEEQVRTRVITPRETGTETESDRTDQLAWEELLNTKVQMNNSELIIAVLTQEREDGFAEEQFAVYRNINDTSGPIYITWIDYDIDSQGYKRKWTVPTPAARPETISLYSQDLIGDRSNCIIITGMTVNNEHTMTIFRRKTDSEYPFVKIAEMQIDGSIIIQETGRSLAYQQGITRGQSFNIAAYGHDSSSNNILDQLETIYAYNPLNEQYEQTRVSRIPGSQIEQRRLNEILSGTKGDFENFINDLWYYVSPQGTIDSRQYLYFNPSGREIIFYADETQQVFDWQTSTSTRYGLFVTSQNISISTLRRTIDIQLESIDSIKLRVVENVRLKINVSESWDGSYRRAGAVNQIAKISVQPAIDMLYDSSWGRLQFSNNGEYTITSSNVARSNQTAGSLTASSITTGGHYVFFKIDEHDLLELRPNNAHDLTASPGERRTVYKIENAAGVTILSRVRIGTTGIQDMHDTPITLTQVINEQ
ncbi:MAG: pallilysin-related adhesin [Treponema sp.]|nr:pallilysin-related adhesin [Treponema sp.]